MEEYFDNMHEAIKEFDKYNKENAMPTAPNNASYYSHPDMFQQAYFPIKPLTLQDIREVSTNYLRSVIKYGTADPHVIAMMQHELHERTRWRKINA